MITINEQSKGIAKAWGKQKIKDTEYRLIKYLLRLEAESGVLLCNTVTGELIFLDENEKKLIEGLPKAFDEPMRELIEHFFLVPVDYDEHKSMIQLRKIFGLLFGKTNIEGYTVLPTTSCNARCFYCYEANYKHLTMNEKIAHDSVEFIKSHSLKDKKLSLSWFGGEPSLCIDRIDQICRELCESGFDFRSTMVSNGYLLSRDIAKKAKEDWKLERIQITLDGTEEIYNKVKAYVGIKGSAYKKVLENIGYLLENEICVSVRMNLDKHNSENLAVLISELNEKFGASPYFSAYVFPLFENCGFDPVTHKDDERKWLVDKQIELNNLINANKASAPKTKLPKLSTNHCMADIDSAIIISPDGSLSKCEHVCEENIGNIYEGIKDKEAAKSWKEAIYFDDCKNCPLEPCCVNLKRCFSSTNCFEARRNKDIEAYYEAMKYRYEHRFEASADESENADDGLTDC